MTNWTEGSAFVNGIQLHYYRTGGHKPPVILAHGVTDNGLCWTRLAKALETQFDLIMVDARGHGLSDKPDHGYGAHHQANDLVQLIQALNLNQPTIVGHSMGGVVAAVLADMYPQQVGRLVLEDPAWYPREEDITQEEIKQHAQAWAAAIVQRKTLSMDELLSKAQQDHPEWDEVEFGPFAQAKLQVSPQVTEYDLEPGKPWWEIVPALQCPVLLLTGAVEGQVAITPEIVQEVKALNTNIQLVRLSGAGHNVRREAFDQYLQLVREFLS